MPRLIDHAERERAIATAALAVLRRDGLAHLSVRAVAAEAGLAVASLRHSFPTQNALRRHCLQLIRQRAAERLRRVAGEEPEAATAMLEQLLPLDEERRLELSAQLQLTALALTDDSLREESAQLNQDVRRVCAAVVDRLSRTVGLAPALTAAQATVTLHALLDGLALHAIVDPEESPADLTRQRLRSGLGALLA
jgi:AcrR family transcriptional regulator